ncbi:Hypothetical predicted protein [Lecanosticta acicola]|uniref:WHIM1 domain-containing protein n=1 Tax=Lecanosticta acicola TaxID=111012 RepID=A0AAI8YSZ0_9PEZI|nr:Hypothetical predicted protein [Lecanosticta acicola]
MSPPLDNDSDSELSEAPEEEVQKLAPIFVRAKKATKAAAPPPAASPPRPKRAPSPPHEEVLADMPDIAFVVMFRSRFHEAFPGKTPHFGPQDIERGVVDTIPSPEVQSLLCALLALVLNRKKPVERGHHARALEDAITSHKSQWPRSWLAKNPLSGGQTFETMSPTERLNLLRTLIMWSLSSSEAVSGIIKDRYKQQRHSDDENQPLSVQPWGFDGDKRRYFLVQGLEDSNFRVYREGSRHTKNAHWRSMAGTIEEVKALAEKLEKEDGTQRARTLSNRMIMAIPTFEATEEKRRRKEYRQQRRAAFSRPEPGFGIYEGRTRGKRMRYTYDDEEDASASDATSTRRSTRQQSARSTPFEPGPTYTASGRQIKQPRQGEYGESLLSNNIMSTDELAPENGDESDPVRNGGRATRSGGARSGMDGASNPRKRKHIDGYNSIDDMSDEDDADQSADEWDSDRNDHQDYNLPDADDEDSGPSESEEDELDQETSGSLIVKLKMPSAFSAAKNGTPPTSPPSLKEGGTKADKDPSTDHPIVRIPPPDCSTEEETKPGASKPDTSPVVNGTTEYAPADEQKLKVEEGTGGRSFEPQVVIKSGHPLKNVQYPAPSPTKDAVAPASEYANGHISAPAPPALETARNTMVQ